MESLQSSAIIYNRPKLSDIYIKNFLKKNELPENNVEFIQKIYNSIQERRESACNLNQLKFKLEKEFVCDDSIKTLKIFETLGVKIKEKKIEEKSYIVFAIRNKCDYFQDLGKGTPPSKHYGQKIITNPLNQLDKRIYQAIEEGKLECDKDDRYLRVYDTLLQMLSQKLFVQTSITTKINNDDVKLLEAVMKKYSIEMIGIEHYSAQNICFKGKVNEPCLVGQNEKPMPTAPKKNKGKLDPTFCPDIKFICQGVEIPMHKVVLGKFEYFKNFIEANDSKICESIKMDNFSPKAMKELQNYLYNDQVSEECLENIELSLEVSQLAKMFMMEHLESIAKLVVYKKINSSNFFLVMNQAENGKDKYFEELCKWYTGDNKNLSHETDFTNNTAFQLFQFKGLLEKYHLESLEKAVMDELNKKFKFVEDEDDKLSKKFEYGEDFVKICNLVIDTDDSKMKKLLDILLTKEFINDLKKYKDNYRAEWKALKNYKI